MFLIIVSLFKIVIKAKKQQYKESQKLDLHHLYEEVDLYEGYY